MKITMVIAFQILLWSFCSLGQSQKANSVNNKSASHKHELFIAFYNVENLFDTIDAPGIDDAEFLPTGKNQWTRKKYEAKVHNIAKVIKAMNEGKAADLVGFAEVENKLVLEDLVNDPQLKQLNYAIAHRESPDTRGIDVAMIYKKEAFKPLKMVSLHVDISQYEEKPTRDILMVSGLSYHDTLAIFLNHWPSRRAGTRETEPRRIVAASVLRKAVDSLLHANPYADIVIMGDFNDNPPDRSIAEILQAGKTPDLSGKNSLYNAANNFDWKAGEGSEFYKGDWTRFIQIIFSNSIIKNQLDADGTFTNIHIFKPDWLLATDEAYQQMVPQRTYNGEGGSVGFSDHLPVYAILHLN